MGGRHGDALAAQAVVDLLADAWKQGSAHRTLDLYGPPRRTLAVSTQLIDDGRRTLGVIAAIDDVSERRRLEEIRRDFVANVSHELKTPMGAIGLLAETLAAETDPTVAQRLASRIHTEAFRISRIIDDLLDLSRIEAEEAPPREPVLVNLIMAEAVERMRAAAEQRDVKIELEEPTPPVTVLGDRRQLVSALYNLLENAVKFSYDGSAVRFAGPGRRRAGAPRRRGPRRRASRRATSTASSSASTASTRAGAATAGAPASGCLSSATWPPTTRATSRSIRARVRGRRSASSSRPTPRSSESWAAPGPEGSES